MSAEDSVQAIIDHALTISAEKAEQATAFANQAVTASSGSSAMPLTTISWSPGNVEPPVHIPSTAAPGVDTALYGATYDKILADFTGLFGKFFEEYFPADCNFLAKAQQWLCRTLTVGGTGIAAPIEDQMWQRERARILRDSDRVKGEAISTFAARGFPLPTGALNHTLLLAGQEAQNQIGESSRAHAIKAMEIEIENVRFAVEQSLNYRIKAIQAACDYLRALAMAPEIAMKLATSASDAQARLISAASSYFNARIRLEELKLRVQEFNADHKHDAGKTDVHEFSSRLVARTNTLSAACKAMGDQAAAALNTLHASAQIQASGEIT